MKLTETYTFRPDNRHRINLRRFSYVIRTLCLIGLIISIIAPLSSHAAELIYTLQLASFANERDAMQSYESIEKDLHKNSLNYLRIEKVGLFHAVRLGKFIDKPSVTDFRNSLHARLPSSIVMKAYIKDERIVRIYSDSEPPTPTLKTPVPSPASRTDLLHESKSKSIDYSESVSSAKKMVTAGKNAEALSLLLPFTSDPSRYPVAVSDYIVILVWERRYAEAIEMYESLPQSFPKRDYLRENISKAYYDTGKYLEALSGYESLLNGKIESPDSAEWSRVRADLLMKLERYAEALKAYRMLGERDELKHEAVFKQRDDVLTSQAYDKRIEVINALYEASMKEEELIRDYILVLIVYKRYDFAISTLENMGFDISEYSVDLQTRIAWAYFKTGNTEKAMVLYRRLLDGNPQNVMANIGYSYCLSKEGRGDESIKILDLFVSMNPQNLHIMFARAYAFEQMGKFWSAIKEYDRILKIDSESPTAKRLRLMAMSDIGARTYASEGAQQKLADDSALHGTFKGDMVADRVNWKEYQIAMNMLKANVIDKKNLRARYDNIIALVGNYEMQKAVEEYEGLIQENVPCPEWVLDNIASAYLYLEKPQKALEIYNEILSKNPGSFRSRMGKFYVLQELRKWDEARDLLDNTDNDQPSYFWKGKNRTPNWDKMEVALARGWLFIYEDRLREAEEYFRDMYQKAPDNTNTRSGLAHTYLWRGWPRRAHEEFKIIENLDPENRPAQTGKIQTMNTLSFKKDARAQGGRLLELNPQDKTVKALVRKMKLEEMRELEADFAIGWDDEGFEEVMGKVTFGQPVSLYTRLSAYLLWSTASDEEQKNTFRRTGAGAQHILNSYLQFKQVFSINYNDGKDFGSYSEIYYTPDDFWKITVSYNSFSTDVPLRARVFDIEADMLNLDLAYVESDWRTYSLSLSRQRFSDSNERYQGLLGYEQGLWVRNNWQERVFFDIGVSGNSLDDTPYFNPDNDFSLSVTHMTEHTVRRIYNEAFVYRIYLTAGAYKQGSFSWQAIGSVRYEHDIELSDVHSLLYGAHVGSQAYDGESVTGYGFDLNWRLLF
jgi:biofilm PGA synthesis protein PgaA